MSTFSYSDYEKTVEKAKNANHFQSVGYFKIGDGETALVRINLHSIDDLKFASVHKPVFGHKWEGLSNPYAGINCLDEIGTHDEHCNCPFCVANKNGNTTIDKAKKVCFVPMLVSYKDKTTGGWTKPVPVIWERPASFAKDLVSALANVGGDLTKHLHTLGRIGSGTDTRYSLSYAMPAIYNPDIIPEDFSAFNNFDLSKHSYWNLTKAELEDYLRTGSFHLEDKKANPIETPKTVTVSNTPAETVATSAQTVSNVPETPITEAPKPASGGFNDFTF